MLRKASIAIFVAAPILGLCGAPAIAGNQVTIDWYSVSPTTPDFDYPPCGAYNCGQYYYNANPEVTVGPLSGGRPVVSAANPAWLAEGAGNPLQWWTPSSGITHENATVQSIPVYQNIFVSEGAGGEDTSAFQTAILSATLYVGMSALPEARLPMVATTTCSSR